MVMIPTAARTDHDDEADELAEEDGEQQETEEADTDGGCCKVRNLPRMPMNSSGFWSPLKTGMPLKFTCPLVSSNLCILLHYILLF
jgi:hypothetical protein